MPYLQKTLKSRITNKDMAYLQPLFSSVKSTKQALNNEWR